MQSVWIVVPVAVCIALLYISSTVNSQEYPFRNTSLPFDERVKVYTTVTLAMYNHRYYTVRRVWYNTDLSTRLIYCI